MFGLKSPPKKKTAGRARMARIIYIKRIFNHHHHMIYFLWSSLRLQAFRPQEEALRCP
jgi:hypothetical protein